MAAESSDGRLAAGVIATVNRMAHTALLLSSRLGRPDQEHVQRRRGALRWPRPKDRTAAPLLDVFDGTTLGDPLPLPERSSTP